MKVGDLVKFTEDPIALVTGEADSVGFVMVSNKEREAFVDEGELGLLVEENQFHKHTWHVCFSDAGSVWVPDQYLEVINASR